MLLPRLGSFAIVSGVWFHHWTFQLSVSLMYSFIFPYLLCGLDLFLSASPLPSYCTNSSYEYTCHCSPNTIYILCLWIYSINMVLRRGVNCHRLYMRVFLWYICIVLHVQRTKSILCHQLWIKYFYQERTLCLSLPIVMYLVLIWLFVEVSS